MGYHRGTTPSASLRTCTTNHRELKRPGSSLPCQYPHKPVGGNGTTLNHKEPGLLRTMLSNTPSPPGTATPISLRLLKEQPCLSGRESIPEDVQNPPITSHPCHHPSRGLPATGRVQKYKKSACGITPRGGYLHQVSPVYFWPCLFRWSTRDVRSRRTRVCFPS